MLKNPSSQHPQTDSQDLLTHRSEQTILAIVTFLDLKSLETLQFTNRRMRQLFVSSLWNNLSLVLFSPHSHQINKSSHEMFRIQWFQKYPEGLIEFQNQMRDLRWRKRALEEQQRQVQFQIATKKRQHTIQKYIRIHFKSIKVEKIMLIVLAIFLFTCAFFSGYYKSSSCSLKDVNCVEPCEKKLDRKLFQMIFLPGIFAVFLLYQVRYREMRSEKNLAFQAMKTFLKMIIIIGALFFLHKISHMLLFNSECNEFSSDFLAMEIPYGKTSFLVMTTTFLYYAAMLIFNLCLESCAIYACFNPIKKPSLDFQWDPLSKEFV